FWLQGIKKARTIALPAGSAAVSFIDASDIASVAVVLLTTDAHANQDFDLTGPEAVTHEDVAAEISRAISTHVTYENITPEALQSGLIGAGLPSEYVAFTIMIFGFLR